MRDASTATDKQLIRSEPSPRSSFGYDRKDASGGIYRRFDTDSYSYLTVKQSRIMIIYAVIARLKDAAVLVDCCDPLLKGNAPLVTSVLMEHLRDNPSVLEEGDRLTFVQRNAEENPDFFSHFLEACSTALGEDTVDENYFHMYLSGGVVYCCIGDDADTRDQKV